MVDVPTLLGRVDLCVGMQGHLQRSFIHAGFCMNLQLLLAHPFGYAMATRAVDGIVSETLYINQDQPGRPDDGGH